MTGVQTCALPICFIHLVKDQDLALGAAFEAGEDRFEVIELLLAAIDDQQDRIGLGRAFPGGIDHGPVQPAARATARAAEKARNCGLPAHVEIVEAGETRVNMRDFFQLLHDRHGIETILTEGGPGLYASCLADGAVDDEFLTLSPRFLGEPPGNPRPSLLEGAGFTPQTSPLCRLKSLRKVGDFLYLQSAITYPAP